MLAQSPLVVIENTDGSKVSVPVAAIEEINTVVGGDEQYTAVFYVYSGEVVMAKTNEPIVALSRRINFLLGVSAQHISYTAPAH